MRNALFAAGLLLLAGAADATQPDPNELTSTERFLRCIKTGELGAVRRMLAEDPRLAHASDGEGRPALFAAAHYPGENQERIVELLLAAGSNPNVVWREVFAPLHGAAEHGSARMIRALLAHGAEPDVASARGHTPLMIAAVHGKNGNVRALLKGGAEIDAIGDRGETALHRAMANEKWATARILIEAGANLAVVDDDWGSPLALAALHGEAQLVAGLLERGASPNPTYSQRGPTPLMAAVGAGHLDIARSLLERGADPDGAGGAGYYEGPLHLAAREARLEALHLLVEHRADVNLLNSEGRTPLALSQDPGIHEALTYHGAVLWRPAAELADAGIEAWRLQSWGERRYHLQRLPRYGSGEAEVREMGTITLATEITSRGPVFRDSYRLALGSSELRAELVVSCRADPWLSPMRIECAARPGGEIESFVASVTGTTATVVHRGRESTLELPAGTVTLEALFRLVTLLPREKDSRFELKHVLETGELNLKGPQAITSLGPDVLTRATGDGERAVPCTRYAVDAEHGRVMELWVDADGVLQRIRIDDYKIADLLPLGVCVTGGGSRADPLFRRGKARRTPLADGQPVLFQSRPP